MSHPEKVKGRKWGGSLKKIGRCLPMYMDQGLPDNEQEPKQHNPLGRRTIAVYRPSSIGDEDERHHRRHSTGSKANSMHIAKDVKELRQGSGYNDVDVFKFSELKVATKHFRANLILGEGGFGAVYKGVLDESIRPKFKKSLEVAVKQLNRNGHQGDKEWLTEVNFLGQLSHPNLVKLIGYCCEGEHRLLVYEYMASGSLERHLFRRSSTTMTWLRRTKVALDAAKCLSYLHGLEHSIIYRDLKAANVLLDSNFNAKLSDFGLAKEGPMGDQTHVSTRVMGTFGYAAPEYMMTELSEWGLNQAHKLTSRSLFVPYFKYLLNGCIEYLADGGQSDAPTKKKKKAKIGKEGSQKVGSDAAAVGKWHLRALVLSSLQKCFLYDTGRLKFLDSSNFQVLLKPVVSQMVIEPPSSLEEEPDVPSVKEVDDLLVSCIGQMAATAGSDLQWKPLNYEVLMQTRSEMVRARILGLRIVKSFIDNLKEEYLVLLAETIPFLVELLEDVELSVKTLAQETLKELETLSGENLRQYF